MKKYWVYFPGEAFAYNFFGQTLNEAKQAARDWLGVSRLPRKTEIWED